MDVIIIGGGAAGLMAAYQLSKAGHKVLVLEARNRLGGRIHTVHEKTHLPMHEAGAEFIHGNLPETLSLLQEAGLEKTMNQGDFWQVRNGNWCKETAFFENIELVVSKLRELKEDISVSQFIDQYFREEQYASLRQSLIGYIEGYYAGRTEKASAKSFLEELTTEDEEQFRPTDGYGNLIHWLAEECKKAGSIIETETVVKQIRWSRGIVEVFDVKHHVHAASKVLITVPVGVLTAPSQDEGAITFSPAIENQMKAAADLGYGFALKVAMNFKQMFWLKSEVNKMRDVDLSQFLFAISDEPISTWWTQLPKQSTLLTGWLAGPAAEKLREASDVEIYDIAMGSLRKIFHVTQFFLEQQLEWYKVYNWGKEPFTRGGYSYSTTKSKDARKLLSTPVENTIFFAGEGLYDGPETGTVEAALVSGKEAALAILSAEKVTLPA